jgi:hypothetical protein
LSQALDAIGEAIDALAETIAAPTGAYTGTAGSTSYKYAVVREHPIAQSAPGAPTENSMPGVPLGGRGPLQLARTKRYSLPGAVATVASCAATLNATNYVTITAPAATGTDATSTYAVVRVGAAEAATGAFFLIGYLDDVTYEVSVDGFTAQVTSDDGAFATAEALATAIETATSNAVTAVATNDGDEVTITITAATAGTAGNAIALSVLSPLEGGETPAYMLASGENLTGGSAGTVLGTVATGIAPSGTCKDIGALLDTAPVLPPHSEYGNLATRPAKAVIYVTGYGAGQELGATVGNAAAASVTSATSAAATATALAAAIAGAAGAVVTAASAEDGTTGNYKITLTSTATGADGNGVPVLLSVGTGAATMAVVPAQSGEPLPGNTLQGGVTAAPVRGPRTVVSGVSGF